MATRYDTENSNGARAATLVRRAALWIAPIVMATAAVVSYAINDRRDSAEIREEHRRDIFEIRSRLDSLTRDVSDRLIFVDRDGIRDPVVRMAIDAHVAEMMRRMNVLTKGWAARLKDLNQAIQLPTE